MGIAIAALAAVLLSAASGQAQSVISADGIVESKSGGFKFPDGSLQQAAAVPLGDCPTLDPSDEMIWVGGVCIDKYEASIWDAPVGGNQIIGTTATDYCNPNGQDCDDIYARSMAGVAPAVRITWFQAQAALANSGKRLPTNAEWQMAVRGTPDPGASPGAEDCHTASPPITPELTGERENCVSAWGAFDMVGNLWEWVADWGDDATACSSWSSTFGDDASCVGLGEGETNSHLPGALMRGGGFVGGTEAGPFAVRGLSRPSQSTGDDGGFRGAR